MKYILLLFLILFTGYIPANSQVSKSVAIYLKNKGLILPTQLKNYEEYEREFTSSSIRSLEELIKKASKEQQEEKEMLEEQLQELRKELKKEGFLYDEHVLPDTLTQLRNLLVVSIRGQFYISATVVSTHPTQEDFSAISSEDIQNMHAYLGKLQQAGLASPVSSARVLKRVSNREIPDSFTLVNLLVQEMATEAYYAPAKVKRFAERMQKLGIYSAEACEKAVSLALAQELTEDLPLFNLCERSVVIDLTGLPDYPEQYIPPILQQISTLVPGLDFSGLVVSTDSSMSRFDKNYKEYTVKYELQSKGRRYRMQDFYSPADYDKDGRPDHQWKHGNQGELYTMVFNKVLANEESPYRLYALLPSRGKPGNGQFAVIALRKEQADSLANYSYFNIRPADYSNRFNQKKVDSAFVLFKNNGLLSHLTQAEIDSCREELDSKIVTSGNQLLEGIKGLVFSIDLEYGVGKGQYAEVTRLLAAYSRKAFAPTSIVDEYNPDAKSSFQYGFTFRSKQYSTKLQQMDDWLDPAFYELIQTAIKENDKEGKFFALWPSDGLTVVYLTFKQFAQLKQAGLIETEELGIDN